jgi:hypothetical protein
MVQTYYNVELGWYLQLMIKQHLGEWCDVHRVVLVGGLPPCCTRTMLPAWAYAHPLWGASNGVMPSLGCPVYMNQQGTACPALRLQLLPASAAACMPSPLARPSPVTDFSNCPSLAAICCLLVGMLCGVQALAWLTAPPWPTTIGPPWRSLWCLTS